MRLSHGMVKGFPWCGERGGDLVRFSVVRCGQCTLVHDTGYERHGVVSKVGCCEDFFSTAWKMDDHEFI